jgi:uncharacterized protein (TIGR02646 family)
MRSLSIPTMPSCLTVVASQRPNGPWFIYGDPAEKNCSRDSRAVLLANQSDNCGWCEKKITIHSSHTDHISPKSNAMYAHLTFSNTNLLACCGSRNGPTCGHAKLSQIIADWINPYTTVSLEDYFTYGDDGAIKPSPHLSQALQAEASTAINQILQLNESVLKGQREALINNLNDPQYSGLTSDEIYLAISEFKSVIEQYAPASQAP